MAVALVTNGTGSANASPGTLASITRPTGVESGHFLVFALQLLNPYGTLTPPSGTTEIGTDVVDTAGNVLRVFWKFAGGSEPATYDMTATTSNWMGFEMCAFSGVHATPEGDTATATPAFSVDIPWPSVTVDAAGGLVLLLGAGESSLGSPAYPTDYTGRFPTINWPMWGDRFDPPTGATGTLTGTGDAAGRAALRTIYIVASSEVPDAPTAASGSPASATSVALTWTAPAFDGGSAITEYQITPYIGGTPQTPVDTGSTSTSHTVTGLTTGTGYTFTVAATNVNGAGAESAPTTTITPLDLSNTGYGDGTYGTGTYGVRSAPALAPPFLRRTHPSRNVLIRR